MFDMEPFQHPADAIGKVARGFVGCDPLDLMQRALNANFTIRRARASASSDNPTYLAQRERIYDGMRKAGVPEG